MLNTKRSRVRALSVAGMVAVTATIGAVTYQASAAEVAPAAVAPAAVAPAAAGADARAVSIPSIPSIPDVIKPPAKSRPIGAYLVASGTQNYTCVVPAGAAPRPFSGASVPEAQLIGTGGRIHHFGGPSWQSLRDQSLVTATKVDQSPRTGAIPELLLKVASHSGTGILSKADYISRLYTSGGVAPTT